MKFGVVNFPGSNCERDVVHVLENVLQQKVKILWHKENSLDDFDRTDCIILPGGFSYGDYLRPGAIARFSPIMNAVITFANHGGYVWGICNGFQILCESGLLPGVLLRNAGQQFICENVFVKACNNNTALTAGLNINYTYKIPVAHTDGRYYAPQKTIDKLKKNKQILFQYCDKNGLVDTSSNFNGSEENIAGICNESKNVFGMMPHPERAAEAILGNEDGRVIFESLIKFISATQDDIMDDLLR